MFQKDINKFTHKPTSDIQKRIDRAILVTPKEYCDKWVSQKTGIQPDEWGYTSACVRELSNVLGLSEIAIRKWGKDFDKHPDYVRVNLGNIDKLNDIKEILARI
jgi:hypothetical protein